MSAEESMHLQLRVAEAKSELVMGGLWYLFLLHQCGKSHHYLMIQSVLQQVHELPETLN